MDARAHVVAAGGIAPTRTLTRSGITERNLTNAVRVGQISRICRGWYTSLPPTHPRVRAVRSGGRLTGRSALWEMGAWMLTRPPVVHIALPSDSRSPRADCDVALHWERTFQPSPTPGMVGLADALVRVTLDEPVEVSAPCFDWAFRAGLLDRIGFESIILALPQDARCIREWVDAASQSVLESVARVRLRTRGWECRSQVRVGELGAIDLVVEGHVALELDGREFHESAFAADRRKDLEISREGRHALRVSKAMLVSSWPEVESAIAAALAARRNGDAGISGDPPRFPSGRRHSPQHPPMFTGYPDDGWEYPSPASRLHQT